MLHLPNVTLVCYDALAPASADDALEDILLRVKFADVLLFGKGDADKPKTEAARVIWHEAPGYVRTSHMLNVEWDSGIADVLAWTDDFLSYDYIGAPWPWHPSGQNVGNGGFSLRSKKLMDFLASHTDDFPPEFPDDATLCAKYREHLEPLGFKWAPTDVAARFSYERGPCSRSFGWHGAYNMPLMLSSHELSRRIALANDYVCSKNDWKEMLEIVRTKRAYA